MSGGLLVVVERPERADVAVRRTGRSLPEKPWQKSDVGRLAALLPNARLKVLSGCAHVPQLQAPELFLDAIGDFLPAVNSAPA